VPPKHVVSGGGGGAVSELVVAFQGQTAATVIRHCSGSSSCYMRAGGRTDRHDESDRRIFAIPGQFAEWSPQFIITQTNCNDPCRRVRAGLVYGNEVQWLTGLGEAKLLWKHDALGSCHVYITTGVIKIKHLVYCHAPFPACVQRLFNGHNSASLRRLTPAESVVVTNPYLQLSSLPAVLMRVLCMPSEARQGRVCVCRSN
jgi:hypothetical protein